MIKDRKTRKTRKMRKMRKTRKVRKVLKTRKTRKNHGILKVVNLVKNVDEDTDKRLTSLMVDLFESNKKDMDHLHNAFGAIRHSLDRLRKDIDKLEISESNIEGNIRDNNITRLKELFAKGTLTIDYRFYGNTKLIHVACARNKYDIIKLFIDHGADVNERDKDGRCSLTYMYENKKYDFDCVKLLIENGLDTKGIEKYIMNCGYINAKTLLLLLKHGAVVPTNNRSIVNHVKMITMFLTSSILVSDVVRRLRDCILPYYILEDKCYCHRNPDYYDSDDYDSDYYE